MDFTENIDAETGEYRGFVEGPTDLLKLADIFENWGKYDQSKSNAIQAFSNRHRGMEQAEAGSEGDNSGNDRYVYLEAGEGAPAAKFQDLVLDSVIQKYPAFCEAAIYKRSVDKLKGLSSEKFLSDFVVEFISRVGSAGMDARSEDNGAIQRNRRFMKEHLNECRRRLEDRMKRLNNSSEKVKGVAVARLQGALRGFLELDESDESAESEGGDWMAGSLRSRANLSNQKRRFRVMAEKALATFQEKLPESPLLGAFTGKVQGVQFLISHVQELVGNVGLMENDLAVGRFTLQNGKAVRLAKKLTEVENQIWGHDRLQWFKLDRKLVVSYEIMPQVREVQGSDGLVGGVWERLLEAMRRDLDNGESTWANLDVSGAGSESEGWAVCRSAVASAFGHENRAEELLVKRNMQTVLHQLINDSFLRRQFIHTLRGRERNRKYAFIELFFENPALGAGCNPFSTNAHVDCRSTESVSADPSLKQINPFKSPELQGCMFFSRNYIAWENARSTSAVEHGLSNDLHNTIGYKRFIASYTEFMRRLVAVGALSEPFVARCESKTASLTGDSKKRLFNPAHLSYLRASSCEGCGPDLRHSGAKNDSLSSGVAGLFQQSALLSERLVVQNIESRILSYNLMKARGKSSVVASTLDPSQLSKKSRFTHTFLSRPNSNQGTNSAVQVVRHPLVLFPEELSRLVDANAADARSTERRLVEKHSLCQIKTVKFSGNLEHALKTDLSGVLTEDRAREWLWEGALTLLRGKSGKRFRERVKSVLASVRDLTGQGT